jgi:hypothetical protein
MNAEQILLRFIVIYVWDEQIFDGYFFLLIISFWDCERFEFFLLFGWKGLEMNEEIVIDFSADFETPWGLFNSILKCRPWVNCYYQI